MENHIDIQCINNELVIKDEELYNICIKNNGVIDMIKSSLNHIKDFHNHINNLHYKNFYQEKTKDHSNLNNLKNQIEKHINECQENIKDNNSNLNNFKNDFFEKFKFQHENIIEKIFHDKFYNDTKFNHDNNQTIINTLNDKFDTKVKEILHEVKLGNEKITSFKNQNHVKGIEGEDYIHNLISHYFNNNDGYTIERTNDINHKGDFIISKNNIQKSILIDVKNYSGKVPDKEVQKFFKDMDTNQSHGILISINSDISGKHLLIEKYKNNTFAMFIPNLSSYPDYLRNMIYIIFSIEEFFGNQNKDIYISNQTFDNISSIISTYNTQIKNIIDTLNTSIKNLEKLKLDTIKNLIYSNIPSTSSNYKYFCKFCPKKYIKQENYIKHLESCKNKTNL